WSAVAQPLAGLITLGVFLVSGWWFWRNGTKKLARRLGRMTEIIRSIAEEEGNLRQRLDTSRFVPDETGELGRWVNSFIDNLDTIVGRLKQASRHALHNSEQMLMHNQGASDTAEEATLTINQMLTMIQAQLQTISSAQDTEARKRHATDPVAESTRVRLETVTPGTQKISDIVESSALSVQQLNQGSNEMVGMVSLITDITGDT